MGTERRTLPLTPTHEQTLRNRLSRYQDSGDPLMVVAPNDVAEMFATIDTLRAERDALRATVQKVDIAHSHSEACEECQDEGGCEVGMDLWGDAMVAVRVALAALPTATPAPDGRRDAVNGRSA